ncbi:TolC family protein [Chryseolinea sp. T2]|uniref:TolC family protein n=1 Tax=Chryseolinea sp. T2 TaxID=3129255 RepID=UPI00307738A4
MQTYFDFYKLKPLCLLVLTITSMNFAQAQRREQAPPSTGDTLQAATLDQVVAYAIAHQPLVKQAETDESIANSVIRGKLADWLPQLNFSLNYQRYFDLQSSVIGGNVVRFGVDNTSSAQFTATQNVFNRDALLASTTASKVRIQAEQNTEKSKIDVVVNVTKAFYDLLATEQQISVNQESIVRLQRSLKDARSRYDAGIADKTDYKRAQIQLANTQVSLQTAQELLKYKKEFLKMLMGYPVDRHFNILYDTAIMEQDVPLDTAQELVYTNNIDYRILYMQKELQEANVKYANWAYLPSVNLFGAYIVNYQNDAIGELYHNRYPFSYAGATLAFPIFQGGKRIAKVREQRWTSRRIEWGLANLRSSINTEYNRALATYKSNLTNYNVQKENVELAREVYDVIQLQYSSGIRPYLDVTVAETDLRTTRINYFNALYAVLASKMDVLRALGQINYQ